MIQGNEFYQDFKLERENYFLDQHLTNTVLSLPQFAGKIADSKLLFRIIEYVHENKLLNNNQKMAIGYQDIDGERCRRYGIYIFTDPSERVLEIRNKVLNRNTKISSEEYNQQMNSRRPMSITFQDVTGEECVIEESSSDKTPMLWLGIKNVQPRIEIKGKGFVDYPLPEEVLVFGSMLLNQEQAKMLIPLLQKFVEHGKLESL